MAEFEKRLACVIVADGSIARGYMIDRCELVGANEYVTSPASRPSAPSISRAFATRTDFWRRRAASCACGKSDAARVQVRMRKR